MVVHLQQKFIIKQIIAEFFDRPDDSETFLFRGTVLNLVLIKFPRCMVYWEQFAIVPLQQCRSDPCIRYVSSSVFLKKNVFRFFLKKTCLFFEKKKHLIKKTRVKMFFFFKTTCFQGKYSQFVTVC